MISILFNQFLLERIPNKEQEKGKQMNRNNIAVTVMVVVWCFNKCITTLK